MSPPRDSNLKPDYWGSMRKTRKKKCGFFSLSEEELEKKQEETRTQIILCKRMMKQHESEEQYLEAAKQKRRLQKLQHSLEQIVSAEIFIKQKSDSVKLEQIGAEEQSKFDQTWNDKTDIYIQKMKTSYETLHSRQQKELNDLREKLMKREAGKRSSSLVINLRIKQHKLAKSKRYVEAENIRRNADIIEQEERIQNLKQIQQSNQRMLDCLYEKHQTEIESLKQKFGSEKRKLEESRCQDHNKLCNRLRKKTLDIQKKHALEMAKTKRNMNKLTALNVKKIPKIGTIPLSARGPESLSRKKKQLPEIQTARKYEE